LPENIYWLRDMGGNINGIDYGIPNKVNILSTIDEIKLVVGADAEVTFFYSGHGTYANVNDGDNELTDEGLAVHDNDGLMDEDGSATLDFIWDGELKSYFSNFATNRLVFVFDTCLAGGMNDLEDISQMVVMATSETQYAYVYSTGDFGEGVFSRYFVNEGMLQGLADNVDHDSDSTTHDVVIEEAFEYAKSNIPSYLKRRQKPVMLDNFTDDLML